MASTTEEKPRRPGRPKGQKKTGGRVRGTPNKLGSTVSEVFRNLMGIDDVAVEVTGKIDGKGYRCRRRLFEMLHGDRDVDTAFAGLLRTCLAYGYGTPRRMEADAMGIAKRRLAFITAQGLQWEQDPLYDRQQKMLEAQARDEALQVEIDKKRQEVASSRPAAPEGTDPNAETLELVRPFDLGEGR